MDQYESFIQELAQRKVDGMSFSEIRADLQSQGIVDPEQTQIIKDIDDIILNQLLYRAFKKSVNTDLIIGVALVVIGVGITLGTYMFNIGGYFIFMYGPILAGISLIGYSQMKSTPSKFTRKKRFGRKG